MIGSYKVTYSMSIIVWTVCPYLCSNDSKCGLHGCCWSFPDIFPRRWRVLREKAKPETVIENWDFHKPAVRIRKKYERMTYNLQADFLIRNGRIFWMNVSKIMHWVISFFARIIPCIVKFCHFTSRVCVKEISQGDEGFLEKSPSFERWNSGLKLDQEEIMQKKNGFNSFPGSPEA